MGQQKSQSEQVREVVAELSRLQKEYQEKQAVLRRKLCELFSSGPATPQREIVKKVVDFFLFNNER